MKAVPSHQQKAVVAVVVAVAAAAVVVVAENQQVYQVEEVSVTLPSEVLPVLVQEVDLDLDLVPVLDQALPSSHPSHPSLGLGH